MDIVSMAGLQTVTILITVKLQVGILENKLLIYFFLQNGHQTNIQLYLIKQMVRAKICKS